MQFDRYMRFHRFGKVLAYNQDWGVNQFPDGQNQLWFKEGMIPWITPLNLDVSITNPAVLDLVDQLNWFRFEKPIIGSIRVTYLYGSRCDKFVAGDRQVANVSQRMVVSLYEMIEEGVQVEVIQPHGDLDSRGLDFMGDGILTLGHSDFFHLEFFDKAIGNDRPVIIFPDESAHGRHPYVLNPWVAGTLDLDFRIINKVRDQVTGEIIGSNAAEVMHELRATYGDSHKFIVVDDICDGGATFIKLMEAAPKGMNVSLMVTHGIFSNGALTRLRNAGYQDIYTTNSYVQPDPHLETIRNTLCHVHNVWRA